MRSPIELLIEIDNYQTPAFREPLTWVSNGERGHLHTRRNCRELNVRNHDHFLDQTITLHIALTKHTICSHCAADVGSAVIATAAQNEVYVSAAALDEITLKIGTMGTRIDGIQGLPLLHAWRDHHFGTQRLLELDKVTTNNGLESWKEQLRQTVRQKMPKSVSQSAMHAGSLYWAASEVFRWQIGEDHGDCEIWGGYEAYNMLGQPTFRHFSGLMREENTGRSLVEAWINLLQKGLAPEIATKTLLEDEKLFTATIGEPDKNSLQTCIASEAPEPGESLGRYNLRMWRKHVRAAACLAFAVWETRLGELTKDMPPALCATALLGEPGVQWRTMAGTIKDLIISTLDWTTTSVGAGFNHKPLARGAVTCHPTIAAYLTVGAASALGIHFTEPVTLTALTALPSKEDIVVALNLWEPQDRNSVYATIGTALAAATRLNKPTHQF